MRLYLTVPVLLGVVVPSLVAQDSARPTGWQFRADNPGSESTLEFVDMPPGWHITTNRAAGIFYHPDSLARGDFRVRSTVFLFDPGRRHRESYGLLIGGRDLDGAAQAYTYFLIRDTGEFLIKRRRGAETSVVADWTASDAIMRYPGGEEQAKNTLAVTCGADTVTFFVNNVEVATVPRAEIDPDGVVGLRVNHGLNIHVTDLTVESL